MKKRLMHFAPIGGPSLCGRSLRFLDFTSNGGLHRGPLGPVTCPTCRRKLLEANPGPRCALPECDEFVTRHGAYCGWHQ